MLVVGAVIVNCEGRAFIHRRGYDCALFPGAWDIPGGHVEAEESPIEALRREVHEETGWRLKRVVCELGEIEWTGTDGISRREINYLVEVDGDLDAPRLEQPQYIEYAWISLDEVDRLIEHRAPEQVLLRDVVARGLREALGEVAASG
jgi:8-oxo-dGTP diphosphatase